MQKRQVEWKWQWERLSNPDKWMFQEWVYPNKIKHFKNKTMIDCGCGSGDHLNLVSKHCKHATGIDLNSCEIARKNNRKNKNVAIIQGDIASKKLDEKFDIVYSIGVIHHTDNPTKTFKNISRYAKKNGRVIIWVYSYEGNFLNRTMLEFLKSSIISKLSRRTVYVMSLAITSLMYIPIYTIYLLPLKFLPFYEYFQNWRIIGWEQNKLNVFDKLNGPTTHFIKKETVSRWFNKEEFKKIHISPYKGVSWRASGTKI